MMPQRLGTGDGRSYRSRFAKTHRSPRCAAPDRSGTKLSAFRESLDGYRAREDCSLPMDDAVVKLASKITVATLAHQSVCALLNFEISFPFRKSGLDQQVEKHQLAAAGRGE